MEHPKVWSCKIGAFCIADLPEFEVTMRNAVEKAFFELTGVEADFCFSGWGGKLKGIELEIALKDYEEST